jgi:hypothetical protein
MMTRQRTVAGVLAMFIAAGAAAPLTLRGAQETVAITGTARKEARKPYTDYSVRARNVELGTVATTAALDPQGDFALAGVDVAIYLVELLDPKGKVICTEGPFDLRKQPVRSNVTIECGKPAAWWLLAAAGLAGITAGIVSNDPASPAR